MVEDVPEKVILQLLTVIGCPLPIGSLIHLNIKSSNQQYSYKVSIENMGFYWIIGKGWNRVQRFEVYTS